MAGHSKWANIKHKKAAQDKKRGKLFTKLLKEVMVSAKIGSPDPDANPRLRAAILSAKKQSVPKDNIEKAIKKATGAGSDDFTEVTYEGYGPFGVAVFVEAATDNTTRTVSNVRSYFTKRGGSLGKDGCLQFVFEQKAVFILKLDSRDEEELSLELIDAGAEDFEVDNGFMTVSGAMESFGSIQKKLETLGIEPEESGLERIPLSHQALSREQYDSLQNLIDALEDDDDVQKVYHNIEFNESFLE